MVVVQFSPEVTIANKTASSGLQEFDQRALRYGVHLIERVYPFLDHVEPTPKTRRNLLALRRTYYVRYTDGVATEDVADDLALAPGVVYAEPVPVNRTQAQLRRVDPNDPRFGEQPELRLLRLPEAWDIVKSEDATPRVVIAIVDGGGEWRHEDLRANVWTNPNEIPGNGIDDDNNGFIDDVHGVNFANRDETDNDPTGLPETPSSARHGTASAGSVGAVTDNGLGIAGPAWNAEIMHINAASRADRRIGYGYEGILYAAANGADIINTSWGGLVNSDRRARMLDETLNLATDMGALVVTSAGNARRSNDLFRFYPARHPRMLSVGATEKDSRRRASFSNYGRLVNVFAPGVDILTTGSDNGYILISGTSFASPLTAGVAALVKTQFPAMGPDALREHIRLTSDNMDAENPGLVGELGRGFVNAWAAVQAPSLPAVRLKRWNWVDDDGDRQIASGDAVTITATVVNYLSDARELRVGLVGAASYPFLDMTTAEADIGFLAGGDSVEIQLEFRVTANAPANQRLRFYTRVRDGAFEDSADILSFQVNRSLEVVHRNLSAFYTATGGDNWTRNNNWDIARIPTEEELGTWAGVDLSEGWLVGLLMPNNNLTGTLPPELGNLPQLQELELFGNNLRGPIPPELGNLEQLQRLDLTGNDLTGPIPPELGNLSQLKDLELYNNDLTGPIPPELGNLEQLRYLQLVGMELTGEIPPELGNLKQLNYLWLYNNELTGPIPPELGNLEQLQELHLYSNDLTGPIPPELGNLEQLQRLDLTGNDLTGPIPPELGKLSKLQDLALYNNGLTGPIPPELGNLEQLKSLPLSGMELTGEIPPELGNLKQLKYLRLTNNDLTGPIPPELGNLEQLQELHLYNNDLTGPIPPELGNLSQLQSLSLWANTLSGVLPPELGKLKQLQSLGLFYNDLTGPIPPELGNLEQLQELQLYGNELTGAIPPELGNLSQLQSLSLWANTLNGALPPELGNLEQLKYLSLFNNDLTGPIPPELGNLSQLQSLSLYSNDLTGPIPPELGNLEQLQGLYLWANTLSGALPPELGKLKQLKYLSLYNNDLTGPIPPELGSLEQLQSLNLRDNELTGEIPPELGKLKQLQYLSLYNNDLTGPIPAELGNLARLRSLRLSSNALTGMLPRSLMQLDSLRSFSFSGQDLCAPRDVDFQTWLDGIPSVSGPTCAGILFAGEAADQVFTMGAAVAALLLSEASEGAPPYTYALEPALPAGLTFDDSTRTISGVPVEVSSAATYTYTATDSDGFSASLTFTIEVVGAVTLAGNVQDQSYPRAQPIVPLLLPEASGGVPPIRHALTPALPEGLAFDDATRMISGTPTTYTSAPAPYTYKASDINGSADSLLFNIEVISPVDVEKETVPQSFAAHGNYPNPFQESTRLVFDLPWPARVTVEVMDITGRRVLAVPAKTLVAGRGRGIDINGEALSSGLYLYRLVATSPEGSDMHVGRFMRLR